MRIFTKSFLTFALLFVAGVASADTVNLRLAGWGDGMQKDGLAISGPTDSWQTLDVDFGASPITTTDNVNLRFVNTTLSVTLLVQKVEVFEDGTPLASRDYTQENYPYYWADGWAHNGGAKPFINNGALTINAGTYDHCFVLDWFNVQEGLNYTAKITYKTAAPINWTFDIPADVLKGAAMKIYPAQDPSDVEPTNGIYTCEAPAKVANPWDTQFWVVAKEAIPAGTPVRVTFDYKADAAHTTGPQTFRGPGDYIGNIDGQDVTFGADWKTATVEFKSPSNDFQSVGLSLNLDEAVNTYYFRNLKMITATALEEGETAEDGYIKKGVTFSTEWYCNAKWDEASKTLTWGTYVAADSEFPSPAWTFMTMDGVSGDITKWNQLHLNVSDFDNALEYKLRVVFKENDGSNPPSGPTVEVDGTPDGKGNIDIDLAKLDWSKCDRTKIQDVTIYGLDRIDATKNASVKVNEAWLTTKPAEAKPDGPASIPTRPLLPRRLWPTLSLKVRLSWLARTPLSLRSTPPAVLSCRPSMSSRTVLLLSLLSPFPRAGEA